MEKYKKYELLLGRPLNDGDKKLIDYGLAMGSKITIENGGITVSTRLTPEQEKIVEEAKNNGTLRSFSISCEHSEPKPREVHRLYAYDRLDSEPTVVSVRPTQISQTSKNSRTKNFFGKVVSLITGDTKEISHQKRR